MASPNDLQIHYSGGASNVDFRYSLGGARSTALDKRVKSQNWTNPLNVTGVAIIAAFGNTQGVGSLKWDFAVTKLLWKPSGSSKYIGLTVSGNGVYVLGDSEGYIVVHVVS